METWLAIFVLSVFGIVFIAFAVMIVGSQKLAPEETGLIPQVKALGGGWIGPWKFTFPFVQVRLYDTFLVIGTGTSKPIVLTYTEIEAIVYKSYSPGFLMKGFTVIHHKAEAPKRLVLYLTDESLKKRLQAKTAYSEV
jgi:hypothetical protein